MQELVSHLGIAPLLGELEPRQLDVDIVARGVRDIMEVNAAGHQRVPRTEQRDCLACGEHAWCAALTASRCACGWGGRGTG